MAFTTGYPQPALVLVAVCVTATVLLLRWAALPKPIPGIPYNKISATRISGDGPEMKKAAMARRVRFWMRDQFAIHNSPIIQLFIRPFGKPYVLVSDFRESQDILIRRTKEFDRSIRSIEAFRSLVGNGHIALRSTDHRFMKNKALVRDLMSPPFLNEVSALEIHEKMASLLHLWTLKTRDSRGRPFEASQDLDMVSLDIIMSVAFEVAQGDSTLAKQVANWKTESTPTPRLTAEKLEEPCPFPSAELDPEWQACVYLTESIAVAFRARQPRIAHWLYLQRPHSRRMLRLKDRLIARNIEAGKKRLEEYRKCHAQPKETPDFKHMKLKCAVDQILLREMAAAEKLRVQPNFHKRAIYDELFVYIIGGHDTTSSTLAWWVKYAARYQRSQSRLRDALYAAHSTARSERRLPTAAEIAYTSIPYLSAVIQETLRYSHIAPAVLRQATVDTKILGYAIPKGTDVFMNTSAASFLQPAFDIAEERRAESAQQANDCRAWNAEDIGEFIPERWLQLERIEENGTTVEREVFDSQAGPMLAFGVGHRACFGRKLVYLDLQIALTLLIWSFEFLEMEQLNGFEVVDSLSQRPRDCFVKLRKIEH